MWYLWQSFGLAHQLDMVGNSFSMDEGSVAFVLAGSCFRAAQLASWSFQIRNHQWSI